MNGNFLGLNGQAALLGIVLAVRALSPGSVPAAWTIEVLSPDSAGEQRLATVCEVAPRVVRGYLVPLADSMVATAGAEGFAMTERVGPGSAC